MGQGVKPEYHIVIPARYASVRLPGKLLLGLAGLPLLQHVWQRAMQSAACSVTIACDDKRIQASARSFGASVVMTGSGHPSGSDRIAECADRLGWPDETLVVNLQGDEPLMPPACLDQVATLLAARPDSAVASLYWPMEKAAEVLDPNIVKVVTDAQGNALYFSRSAIPYTRNHDSIAAAIDSGERWKRHLGVYAYRLEALRTFAAAPAAPLERTEMLEQLRFLEQGGRIAMVQACEFIPAGIDTKDDLARINELISSKTS